MRQRIVFILIALGMLAMGVGFLGNTERVWQLHLVSESWEWAAGLLFLAHIIRLLK